MDGEKSVKRNNRKAFWLIVMCWLIYVSAQLGRYSYTSNVNSIMSDYGINHAQAGLPTTLFFFTYGAGQIISGILCKRFNKKWVLSGATLIAGAINIAIFLGAPFVSIAYLWAINGLVQSTLWASLLLTLSENIETHKLSRTSFVMSTASLGGTFISYGLSALFSLADNYMLAFIVSGALMCLCAVLWFALYDVLTVKKVKTIETEALEKEEPTEKKPLCVRNMIAVVTILSVFVALTNAISGGLKTWIPAILKETYDLSDALSIFMSVFLPLFGLLGSVIAEVMYRFFRDFVLLSTIACVITAVLILVVIYTINVSWVLILVLFALITIFTAVVANASCSRFPLYMRDKGNSGFFAGFFNGCAYLGSAISTYGMGAIADSSGWLMTFWVFFIFAAVPIVIGSVYLIVTLILRNKKSVKEGEKV